MVCKDDAKVFNGRHKGYYALVFSNPRVFVYHAQVLFLLYQLSVFTTQDDLCKPATVQQASAELNKSGGGPLGTFNKNYMAFTWDDVVKNFNNLITQQPGNFTAAAAQNPSSFPSTSRTGTCTSSQASFPYCDACPVVTDLGPGRFPRYINEVICDLEHTVCGSNADGFCITTSIEQELLMEECDSSTDKMKLVPYTQSIRSCCECMLF